MESLESYGLEGPEASLSIKAGKGTTGSGKGKTKNSDLPISKKDVLLVMFTFINCCVGAGLLAIGKIFSVSGLVMSAIYMVACMIYCYWSFRVLAKSSYHGDFATMRESGEKLWGRRYGLFVDVCLILATVGFFCSYVSVSSDYIREGIYRLGKESNPSLEVLGSDTWKVWFKPIISAAVIFPLTLVRTIDKISVISSFAIIFALVAFIGINVRFFQYIATNEVNGKPHRRPEVPVFPTKDGWYQTIAYFTTFFALFTIQANMIPLQRELNGTPSQRLKIVNISARWTIIICAVLYIVTGVEGAIMFNRSCPTSPVDEECIPINANILLTFGDDIAMIIIKLLYAIVVIVSFPCMIYPVRASICRWFNIDKFNGKKTYPNMTKEEQKQLPLNIRYGYLWYILIGLIILIFVTIIAIVIPDIDKVLTITANIFGLIIFQLHEVYVWFKLPLMEPYSVGSLIDKKLVEGEEAEQIRTQMEAHARKSAVGGNGLGFEGKDNENSSEFGSSRGTDKSGSQSSTRNPSEVSDGDAKPSKGLGRLSKIYRNSMGSVDKSRKYSLVLQNQLASEYELKEAFGRKSGERTWEDDGTESCSSEDFPNLALGHRSESSTSSSEDNKKGGRKIHDKSSDGSTTADSTSSSMSKRRSSKDDVENNGSTDTSGSSTEDDDSSARSARASLRRVSSLQTRAKSVIEGCPEGAVEVVFPDISHEPYRKNTGRFVVFIIFNVFFIGFSVAATVCNIISWAQE